MAALQARSQHQLALQTTSALDGKLKAAEQGHNETLAKLGEEQRARQQDCDRLRQDLKVGSAVLSCVEDRNFHKLP